MTSAPPASLPPEFTAAMRDPEVRQILPPGTQSIADVADPARLPWVNELPDESSFSSAIQGSGPADTSLRQREALTVLISVVRALGTKLPRERDRINPRVALARFVLQTRALDKQGLYSPGDLTSLSAEAISRRKAVRDHVLKTFFSKGSIAAYRATPEYAATEAQHPVPPWVATDVSKARSAHGDLSVFGLQLGQPLELPACSDDQAKRAWSSGLGRLGMGVAAGARAAPETCVGDLQGEFLSAKGFLGALSGLAPLQGDAAAVKGAHEVGIALGRARCPDWLATCSLAVTTIDGVMLGATIAVEGTKADKALADLKRRFGKADGSRPNRCTYQTYSSATASNGETVRVPTGSRTVEGTALSWSKPGIYVAYVPYGGTECVSRLYVELASVHSSAASETTRAEAQQPGI